MIKILSLSIHISLVIWASSIYAQCNATYNPETEELSIPRVQISPGGTGTDFKVEMKKASPLQMIFEITKAEEIDQNGFFVRRIRDNGSLLCGGRTDLAGFGYTCPDGRNCGFDIDLCRAVSAAVLNLPTGPIDFVPISTDGKEGALKERTIDMLSRNTTWTSFRDAEWGNFTWTMFYDGQGFMVKKDSNITTIAELDGKSICVVQATTTFQNLEDEFSKRNLTWIPIVAKETSELMPKYLQGECEVITTDKSGLAARRAGFNDPQNHRILDITISKEPLTPAIPAGDDQFFDIVKLVMFSLINAEELEITQANVERMIVDGAPDVKRLLGVEGDFGQERLGLAKEAIAQAIRAVGNYGEIYERHLGPNGVDIPRGPNQLWRNGGLIYAPPIR